MKITYYGHSCFLVQLGNIKVLFDPFISPNELASGIDVSKIETDYILISHGHSDHVADVEPIAKRTGAKVVSSFETVQWFAKKGIDNIHPMNIGGKWKFDFGNVRMVSAVHSNSLPDGSYGGTEAGFVIESEGKTFYYSGDTALHMDMKMLGERYKLDLAFLCIGDNFTMDVEDAMLAAKYVGADKIIGMHYDTFPYIKIDAEKAKDIARKANKELVLMDIGQTINL